jgi:hypothetical protein
MAANKTERLASQCWPVGVWSNSSNPLYGPPEDHAPSCWLLFFASSFSGIALFFAAVCLIGCNGLATSGRPSTTSSADSLRIATAPPVGTVQSGYSVRFTHLVQSPYDQTATAENAFSLATISPKSAPSKPVSPAPLQIMTDALPAGTLESNYDATLVATGGVPPYYWDAMAGQIAPGLTLRSSAGTISGIPFAVGTFSFTARVWDSTASSLSVTLSLNISDAALPTVSDVAPIRARLRNRRPDFGCRSSVNCAHRDHSS